MEPATWDALTAAVPHLTVSRRSACARNCEGAGSTPHASAALKLYAASGALAKLYPELAASCGLELEDEADVERDAFGRARR
jgi:uncharacterized protein YukE